MNCCSHNQGLNSVFSAENAQSELKAYWKKGIDKHARRVVEVVSARGVQDATVLEVGAGLGGLHIELLKRGAARAADVDVSAGYLAAAQTISEQLGLRDRVTYHYGDFAQESARMPTADITVLHRVICCYPDMPPLVTAAAQHTRKLLVLTFPQDAGYIRLAGKIANFGLWLSRSQFRIYIHSPVAIRATAEANGLRLVQEKLSWPWQIALFERA